MGIDQWGLSVPSGVYVYRLNVFKEQMVKKLLLLMVVNKIKFSILSV